MCSADTLALLKKKVSGQGCGLGMLGEKARGIFVAAGAVGKGRQSTLTPASQPA